MLPSIAPKPIMREIAHIQLLFSFDQVPLFISQLNKVINIITCFQSVVNGDAQIIFYGGHWINQTTCIFKGGPNV
jgi:hypothetical protein